LEDWVQMFKNEILAIKDAEIKDKAKETSGNADL
jgi:hypothetical protein